MKLKQVDFVRAVQLPSMGVRTSVRGGVKDDQSHITPELELIDGSFVEVRLQNSAGMQRRLIPRENCAILTPDDQKPEKAK